MYLPKNVQFLIRELNKNKSKITRVFFTIFISLLIFSSVLILKNSIEIEIKNNSRIFLGGDLEISKKNKPLNIDYLNQLKNSFFLTEVIEFTSIISNKNDESKTTRIKVIDDFYPLVGNAKVEPANSLKLLQTKQDSILIDKTTKDNLDLRIGDKIKIQNITLEIIGVIENLPDIGSFFLFGDQALINKSSFKNLKLNNLGSFINFKYKMIGKNSNSKLPKQISENKKVTIKFPDDISRNLKKTIENFIYFLSIIAASAILISGIGLKNSLYSFFSNKYCYIQVTRIKFPEYQTVILYPNPCYFGTLFSHCLFFKFIDNLFLRL
jgi:putative ABC transport system permease protein